MKTLILLHGTEQARLILKYRLENEGYGQRESHRILRIFNNTSKRMRRNI